MKIAIAEEINSAKPGKPKNEIFELNAIAIAEERNCDSDVSRYENCDCLRKKFRCMKIAIAEERNSMAWNLRLQKKENFDA